jgi:alkylation response protein AidB-like acyl-CoA dehydrogenase
VGRRISISRTLTYQLARNLSAPKTYGAPGSNTNYTFSIATAQTVLAQSISAINSAMELMASAGYATEWQLERYWRDTKALECCLGPTTALQTQMAAQYFESNVR